MSGRRDSRFAEIVEDLDGPAVGAVAAGDDLGLGQPARHLEAVHHEVVRKHQQHPAEEHRRGPLLVRLPRKLRLERLFIIYYNDYNDLAK